MHALFADGQNHLAPQKISLRDTCRFSCNLQWRLWPEVPAPRKLLPAGTAVPV